MARAFRFNEAAAFGVTVDQLRGKRFTSPFHGVHVADPCASLADRCRAALLVIPAESTFSDETAAALMGLPDVGEPAVVHVTVPVGVAQIRRRGVVGHVRDLLEDEVGVAGGLRVTSAARTFLDLAARLPRHALVGIGDAMLRAGLARPADLAEMAHAHAGRRGSGRVRAMVALLEARAESVMESALRLLLLDAGLPMPEVNVNLYDALGNFIARGDLVYRKAKIVVEYDGDQHRLDRAQFVRDVRRGSELAASGYLVLRFTASDVYRRPQYVVATVRAALAQRAS
jgi:very-short-patch-repair endonuclease